MNLKEILEKGESETLEFKKSTAQLEKALKSVCAFLNYKGGKVYFGIAPDRKIIGQWGGTGTNRMIKACLKRGLPEPRFEEITGDLVVTFRKYRISDEDLEKLNERQKKAVEFLKEEGWISLGKYIEHNPGVTEKTSYRDLKRMEELGLIKSVGKKKGRYYVLV